MDPDIEKIIRKALADAKVRGNDHVTQAKEAVSAAQQAHPDMTSWEALAAVNFVRRH